MGSKGHFDVCHQTLCSKLKQEDKISSISEEFAKLQTDEARVQYVWRLESTQNLINLKPKYAVKSQEKAARYRTDGNKCFQAKEYERALELYTESILHSPLDEDGKKNLSLAYANRSAAFFNIEEYKYCLADIERALESGYPQELLYKVYERQGRCFQNLGNFKFAIESFKKALSNLSSATLKEDRAIKLQTDLEKLLSECENSVENGVKVNGVSPNKMLKEAPVFDKGHHEMYPSLAACADVKYEEARGRFIVAAEDIEPGELILIEKPYASVVLQNSFAKYCHYCQAHTVAPLPCPECATIHFCSKACMEAATESFHKYECKILLLLVTSGIGKFGHLALRAVTVSNAAEYENFRSTLQNNSKSQTSSDNPAQLGCDVNGKYLHDDYNTIFNLVTHASDRAVPDLFRRAYMAVYLLKMLQLAEYFQGHNNNEDLKMFIGGMLLSHLQSFPCNAHEISEMQLNRQMIEASMPLEIGAGIYSTLSLFNHSCNPNVNRNFYGDTCVVRAMRPVKRGEELADNYGAVFAVHTKQERLVKLAPQYFFDCCCQPCEEDWPLYHNIEASRPKWRCPKCQENLEQNGKDNAKCNKCGATIDQQSVKEELSASSQTFTEGLQDLLSTGAVEKTLPVLLKHMQTLDKLVSQPWQEFNNCQEAIKQCWAIMGNCWEFGYH